MALIPELSGEIKSIERQIDHPYYKAKFILTKVHDSLGWLQGGGIDLKSDQTIFTPHADAIGTDCQPGHRVSICAFPLSDPDSWEMEGNTQILLSI